MNTERPDHDDADDKAPKADVDATTEDAQGAEESGAGARPGAGPRCSSPR